MLVEEVLDVEAIAGEVEVDDVEVAVTSVCAYNPLPVTVTT